MSALASPAPVAFPGLARDGLRDAYAAELQKLFAQLTTRLVALLASSGRSPSRSS